MFGGKSDLQPIEMWDAGWQKNVNQSLHLIKSHSFQLWIYQNSPSVAAIVCVDENMSVMLPVDQIHLFLDELLWLAQPVTGWMETSLNGGEGCGARMYLPSQMAGK